MSSLRLIMARFSIVISLIVLTIKYSAYLVSGSDALLSDAIETILNVIAAIGMLGAVLIAMRPADDNHPYGHGKAEYLWAVIEGVLVILTALGILGIALHDILHPKILHETYMGVFLNFIAGCINFIWARLLLYLGKTQDSQALLAAGSHVQSDVWASIGLILGVLLIPIFHLLWIDPLLSALIALNVLWTGFSMMRRSASGLMDEAPHPKLIEKTCQIITKHGHGALEAHDLRMRKVGALFFVEFHLVVSDDMKITQAHDICDTIEAAIRQYLGRASIHIHVEPERMAKRHLLDKNIKKRHVLVLTS